MVVLRREELASLKGARDSFVGAPLAELFSRLPVDLGGMLRRH